MDTLVSVYPWIQMIQTVKWFASVNITPMDQIVNDASLSTMTNPGPVPLPMMHMNVNVSRDGQFIFILKNTRKFNRTVSYHWIWIDWMRFETKTKQYKCHSISEREEKSIRKEREREGGEKWRGRERKKRFVFVTWKSTWVVDIALIKMKPVYLPTQIFSTGKGQVNGERERERGRGSEKAGYVSQSFNVPKEAADEPFPLVFTRKESSHLCNGSHDTAVQVTNLSNSHFLLVTLLAIKISPINWISS